MFKELLEMFRKPSAGVEAQRELEQAKRELLCAYTGAEYASAMVDYHIARITRLEAMIKSDLRELNY